MRILTWHIGRAILSHTAVVYAVLLGLFTFINLIDELKELGAGNYGGYELARYVLFTTPRNIYELFPMAALLGTMLGLSSLAVDSELIVMRASGISLLQIVGAVMKVGVVFVILAVVIGEFVTPIAETTAQRERAHALQKSIKQQTDFGLWMRDQSTFINIGEVLPNLTLLRIRVFEFDEQRKLRSLAVAKEAHYEHNRWRLTDVRHTLFADDKVQASKIDAAYWNSVVAPEILSVFLIKPDQLSAWHLARYIEHLRENAQETGRYELAFWYKLIAPLSTGAMVILAIPFVFRQVRSGGLGQSLLIGIMLGLAFYLTSRGFGYFVLLYGIPPFVGAVTPTVLFFAIAIIMLRRVA